MPAAAAVGGHSSDAFAVAGFCGAEAAEAAAAAGPAACARAGPAPDAAAAASAALPRADRNASMRRVLPRSAATPPARPLPSALPAAAVSEAPAPSSSLASCSAATRLSLSPTRCAGASATPAAPPLRSAGILPWVGEISRWRGSRPKRSSGRGSWAAAAARGPAGSRGSPLALALPIAKGSEPIADISEGAPSRPRPEVGGSGESEVGRCSSREMALCALLARLGLQCLRPDAAQQPELHHSKGSYVLSPAIWKRRNSSIASGAQTRHGSGSRLV